MKNPVYKRAVDLMEADIGDELVALDSERGECFAFNAVAASVWRKLSQPASLEQLRQALLDEYDVGQQQCKTELDALLAVMVEKRLVVVVR